MPGGLAWHASALRNGPVENSRPVWAQLEQLVNQSPVRITDARDYDGYDPKGKSDSSRAIQRAIADMLSSGGGHVFLGSGTLRVDTPLNCANHGDTSVTLQGVGTSQTSEMTTLRGNTGTFVLDRMGSQYMNLRGFRIFNDGTESNPSTGGIVMGRTATNQFAQFDHDDDVMIFLLSRPGASARGTIGIYNVGAEHWYPTQVRCIADSPFVMASTDVLGLPGPWGGAHAGPASMTLCDLNQTTATSWTNYAYEFWDAHNIHLRHVYAARASGTAAWAFNFNTAAHAISISGQIEQWPALMNLNANISCFEVDATIVSPTQPLIVGGGILEISTSRIRVQQLNGSVQPVLGTFVAGSTLRNSDVWLHQDQSIASGNLKALGSRIYAYASSAPITLAAGSNYAWQTELGWKDVGSATTQTKRVTTGSVGASSTASVTVTWPVAFADTNYTATVSVEDTNSPGLRVLRVTAKSGSSITVLVTNDGAGAITGTLDALAIHD